MPPSTESPVNPAMLEALLRRSAGREAIRFSEFMDVALYDPVVGYYRKDKARIGFGSGTDFLTATTSSPVFGRLVAAACVELLGPADPGMFEFVEIGAERGAGVLDGVDHRFASVRLATVGETLAVEGPSIVFSNELFDAQPFRRFRRTAAGWREMGVSLGGPGLAEVVLEGKVPDCAPLPEDAQEGYTIDAPLAAASLAASLASMPWEGLFLAFDYGKSWQEIAYESPAGTGRAYRRHAQGNDLLSHPGNQDLTCHVCWDWIRDALGNAGFKEPKLESQEAFFVRHASACVEAIAAAGAGRVSREKLSLMQLLHPAHMGQKFQALWALRGTPFPP
jgi:SAM-dependent MidA family methyltransferase